MKRKLPRELIEDVEHLIAYMKDKRDDDERKSLHFASESMLILADAYALYALENHLLICHLENSIRGHQ